MGNQIQPYQHDQYNMYHHQQQPTQQNQGYPVVQNSNYPPPYSQPGYGPVIQQQPNAYQPSVPYVAAGMLFKKQFKLVFDNPLLKSIFNK